jgi:uncharacterized membrane-anchored protein
MENADLVAYLVVGFLGVLILAYSLIIAGNIMLGVGAVVLMILVVELVRLRRLLEQHLTE